MKRRTFPRAVASDIRPAPLGSTKRSNDRGTAMSILLLFARHRSLSAEQIGGLLRLPTSAIYRHLNTLLQAGFVVQSQVMGRYSAGPEVVRLADNYREEALAQGEVRQGLQRLSGETGELAAYLVQSGMEALCVESVESSHILSCSYAAGRSRPLLHGASARAILAFLPEEDRDEILTNHFLSQEEEHCLRENLASVRARGYATSSGALAPGVWGISAPVFDNADTLAGVITTMVPLERTANEGFRAALTDATCRTARELTNTRARTGAASANNS
jgi:DNA-binding IclR family transcriptional regulator